jgi:hypothetical protein
MNNDSMLEIDQERRRIVIVLGEKDLVRLDRICQRYGLNRRYVVLSLLRKALAQGGSVGGGL